jgi:hypothetical protein
MAIMWLSRSYWADTLLDKFLGAWICAEILQKEFREEPTHIQLKCGHAASNCPECGSAIPQKRGHMEIKRMLAEVGGLDTQTVGRLYEFRQFVHGANVSDMHPETTLISLLTPLREALRRILARCYEVDYQPHPSYCEDTGIVGNPWLGNADLLTEHQFQTIWRLL